MHHKKRFRLTTATIIGLASCLIATTTFGFSPSNDDEQALLQLVADDYTSAINAEDSAAFAAAFTDDGIRVSPNRAPEATRATLKAGIEKVFSVFDFDVAVEVASIEVDGNFAMVHGIGRGLRSKTSAGKETKFAARSIWMCKRVEGQWQIWRQVWYPIKQAK